MARGLLQFTIRSANNLHKHDIFGRQQPYCQVECGVYSCKTKTSKDGGQNPVWNETLFFQLNNEIEVHIMVLAEQRIGKDAVLGSAVIPIASVRVTGQADASVPVMRKGCQAGLIHVSMEFKGPALTNFGQVGQVVSGRSAISSFTGSGVPAHRQASVSSTTSQDGPVRFASMPIRLLQQSPSPLLASQQQQQQSGDLQQQQLSRGDNSASAAAAAAAAEARELVLQRQLSRPDSNPATSADVATLQQTYPDQLQQLQILQEQLLSNFTPEQQQLLLAGQQQGAGNLGLAGQQAARLLVPKQPRKTAADLFLPDPATSPTSTDTSDDTHSSTYLNPDVLSSAGFSSLQDSNFVTKDVTNGGTGCKLDMSRLQAIIAKVYPADEVAGQAAEAPNATAAAVAAAASGNFMHLPAAAAATSGVAAPYQPSSVGVGAFGAAAALAAAAAAGATFGEPNNPGTDYGQTAAAATSAAAAGVMCDVTSGSIGLGGFGGSAGAAAAAAAAGLDLAAVTADSSAAAAAGSSVQSAGGSQSTAAVLDSSFSSTRSGVLTSAAMSSVSAANSTASAAAAGTVRTADWAANPTNVCTDQPAAMAAAAPAPAEKLSAALADEILRLKTAAPLLAEILGLSIPQPRAAAAAGVWPGAGSSVTADKLVGSIESCSPGGAGNAAGSTSGTVAQVVTTTAPQPPPPAANGLGVAAAATAITQHTGLDTGSSNDRSRVAKLEQLLSEAYQEQDQLRQQVQDRDCQLQLLLQQCIMSQQQIMVLQARVQQLEQPTDG